jgi:hypothetical protein
MTLSWWAALLFGGGAIGVIGFAAWRFVRWLDGVFTAKEQRDEAIQKQKFEEASRFRAEAQRDIANGPRRNVRGVLRRMRARDRKDQQ